MKLNLNKLFLFYSEAYRRQFTMSHTLFFLIPVGLLFILHELVWWIAAIMVLINIAIFSLVRRDYPSSLEADEEGLSFIEYNQLGKAGYGVKAKITLKNVRRVKYEQSKFEKAFNIGRITVVADASFKIVTGKLGNAKYPLSRSYSFYGIKNYSEAKEYFEKNYK